MPTRTQQSDLLSVAYASHGDTRHIALFPADPGECFEFAVQAFDLAERFQTPTFVVSDLDIGMNDWMCPRLRWNDEYRPDRGEVLTAEQLDRIGRFSRYLDTDGDGVAARSLPGVHPAGAYFVRGSGHDQHAGYTEDPTEYVRVMERLALKHRTAAGAVPAAEIHISPGARLGLISIGGCHAALLESIDRLAAAGFAVDYMRIRAFPFGGEVRQFLDTHQTLLVVEQNRDAQLRSLLAIETDTDPARMHSLTRYGGFPLTAGDVVDEVLTRFARAEPVLGISAELVMRE
jgi:2-oxoglutarate ferredoxin oxidoreductase subunit alpha